MCRISTVLSEVPAHLLLCWPAQRESNSLQLCLLHTTASVLAGPALVENALLTACSCA